MLTRLVRLTKALRIYELRVSNFSFDFFLFFSKSHFSIDWNPKTSEGKIFFFLF